VRPGRPSLKYSKFLELASSLGINSLEGADVERLQEDIEAGLFDDLFEVIENGSPIERRLATFSLVERIAAYRIGVRILNLTPYEVVIKLPTSDVRFPPRASAPEDDDAIYLVLKGDEYKVEGRRFIALDGRNACPGDTHRVLRVYPQDIGLVLEG